MVTCVCGGGGRGEGEGGVWSDRKTTINQSSLLLAGLERTKFRGTCKLSHTTLL